MIQDSGNRRSFSTGSVRDIQQGKGRFDLIPFEALERLAVHYELGCLKYGERNWEKGQPLSAYFNSAMRHINKSFRGDIDEDHEAAAVWNTLCYLQTLMWIEQGILPKELDDRNIKIKPKTDDIIQMLKDKDIV